MVALPAWLGQLEWQGPYSVAYLNNQRDLMPEFPGLYAFTEDDGPLIVAHVLYIGETGQKGGLRARVSNYLVDFTRPKVREGHKGKGFVLEYRHTHSDHGTFVRWLEYGGSRLDRLSLEASLIHFFNPQMNDREEETRHPVLGDRESLDPRLLR